MDSLERTLAALKDVRGVEGSFFAAEDGRILARDLPRIFDGEAFETIALRICRILEAMLEIPGEHEGALLRYPNHALLIRSAPGGMLCVLATAEVNLPALKRGASLVLRRLPSTPPLPTMSLAPPPLPSPLPAPPPPPRPSLPPPLPSRAEPGLRWRGSSMKDR